MSRFIKCNFGLTCQVNKTKSILIIQNDVAYDARLPLGVLALDLSSSLAKKKTRLWDKICQQFSEIQARRDRDLRPSVNLDKAFFGLLSAKNRASLNSNVKKVWAFLHRCILRMYLKFKWFPDNFISMTIAGGIVCN